MACGRRHAGLLRRLRVGSQTAVRLRRWPWSVPTLTLIVLLTAVLDARSLGTRSIWIDEGVSLHTAHFERDEFLHFIRHEEMNMAFYHLLLRAWIRLGDDEATVRSLSVLAALAALPAVYLLARQLFSPRVGVLSALFLALNPMHYSYAREARAYALTLLLVALGSYLFLRATSTGRSPEWIAYVLVMTLAAYSHFFAIFVIVSHGGYLLLRRQDRLKPAVFSFAALAVLLGPILVYVAFGGQSGRVTAETPTIRDVLYVAPSLTGREALFFYLPAGLVALVAARGRPPFSTTYAWSYRFLLLWLAIPIGLALALTVAATLLAAWTVLSCHPGCRTEIEDWRGVEHLIRAEWRRGDQISFDPPYMVIPFSYYADAGAFAGRRPLSPPGYPKFADGPTGPPAQHRHWIVVEEQGPTSAAPAKRLLGSHDSWSFPDDLVVLRSRTE